MKHLKIAIDYSKAIYIPATHITKLLALLDDCHVVQEDTEYSGYDGDYRRKAVAYLSTLGDSTLVDELPAVYDSREDAQEALKEWKESLPKKEEAEEEEEEVE